MIILLYNIKFSQILIYILGKRLSNRMFITIICWSIRKNHSLSIFISVIIGSEFNFFFHWVGLVWKFWCHVIGLFEGYLSAEELFCGPLQELVTNLTCSQGQDLQNITLCNKFTFWGVYLINLQYRFTEIPISYLCFLVIFPDICSTPLRRTTLGYYFWLVWIFLKNGNAVEWNYLELCSM